MALGLKRKGSRSLIFALPIERNGRRVDLGGCPVGAPHWKLDNLIAIVDVNNMQADGPSTKVLNFEPLVPKWEAFGWHVQRVNGNDLDALVPAFDKAREPGDPRPRVIICDTRMAKGVPFLETREMTLTSFASTRTSGISLCKRSKPRRSTMTETETKPGAQPTREEGRAEVGQITKSLASRLRR